MTHDGKYSNNKMNYYSWLDKVSQYLLKQTTASAKILASLSVYESVQ